MTTTLRSLSDADRTVLRAVMDRLVPPIDELPGAGAMGLVPQVEAMTGRHASFHRALIGLLDDLAAEDFAALPGAAQDAAIGAFEKAQPAIFNALLELVYLAYYADERVHRRIGWRTGPLQPRGFELPPFDEETNTAVSCFVGLSNSGQPVNGVEYNGEGYYSFVATPGNLYLESPIVWR